MFCPKCRSEYNSSYTVCKKCAIALVHEVPLGPEEEREYIEYEGLLETHNPGDIAVIRSILEGEDITYYFLGEHASRYLYHALPIRLMVKRDQIETAKEILKDLELSFYATGISLEPEEDDAKE